MTSPQFIPSAARDQRRHSDECSFVTLAPVIPRCARDKLEKLNQATTHLLFFSAPTRANRYHFDTALPQTAPSAPLRRLSAALRKASRRARRRSRRGLLRSPFCRRA